MRPIDADYLKTQILGAETDLTDEELEWIIDQCPTIKVDSNSTT